MQLLLELENSSKLYLLLEFLKDLKYVKAVNILEKEHSEIPARPSLSKEEALKIVMAGCEMNSFGDPVEFQRQQRSDRNLPFEKQ